MQTQSNATGVTPKSILEIEKNGMHIQNKLNTLRVFTAFYEQPDVSKAALAAIERLQTAQKITITSSDRENGDSIYFRLNEKATAAGWRNWSYHHLKNRTWVAYPLPE